jgi:pimeloyl-ACP methyl ester carboxylesterase
MSMLVFARSLAVVLGLFTIVPLASAAPSPKDVQFAAADGGTVDADLYGTGTEGVVFAHGAIFNKQSWAPQAKRIANHGMRALAIDFRGYGKSHAGSKPNALYLDVIAAVRWLHQQGVEKVDVVGGSMGGGAAGEAATRVKPGEIHKLVLLSPMPIDDPQDLKADSILYIASRDESLAPRVKQQYERAPEPKKLIFLDGSAHAQNIFDTDQAQNLSDDIVNFIVGNRQ